VYCWDEAIFLSFNPVIDYPTVWGRKVIALIICVHLSRRNSIAVSAAIVGNTLVLRKSSLLTFLLCLLVLFVLMYSIRPADEQTIRDDYEQQGQRCDEIL
jgi:hypothetical protein